MMTSESMIMYFNKNPINRTHIHTLMKRLILMTWRHNWCKRNLISNK